MADFVLTLTLYEHGTGQAFVGAKGHHLTMVVSYLADAPGVLTEAAVVLLKSPLTDKITCSWQGEPGEYRWVLYPLGKNVRVQILYFESISYLPDARGQCLLDIICPVMRLATQVKGQLHQMLNEYGEAGYQARWGHPFPMLPFRQLEALISEGKHASVVTQV